MTLFRVDSDDIILHDPNSESTMSRNLTEDLDKVLATICRFFADEGMAREVAVLAHAKATIQQTNYDNWNGGVYGYTIYLSRSTEVFTR